MAITEIVIPCLKQGETTRSEYQETIPSFAKLINAAPGAKCCFMAPIVTENGENVSSAVKYAAGLEWETTQNFYDFLSTPGFQSHGAEVVTHFTAPPQLQIYNTDLSPKAVFSSHLTEVFRIEVGADHSTIDAVRDTWSEFITVIEQILPNVPSLSGTSLNLDQQLFLGVIGWKASEDREHSLGKNVVKELKSKLEGFRAFNSFTISFDVL